MVSGKEFHYIDDSFGEKSTTDITSAVRIVCMHALYSSISGTRKFKEM